MDSDSDSDSIESNSSNFNGFTECDVENAERNLDIVPDSQESISDIDIELDESSIDGDVSDDENAAVSNANATSYDNEEMTNNEQAVCQDENTDSDTDSDDNEDLMLVNPSGLSDIDLFDSCDKPIKWTRNFRDIDLHEFSTYSGPKLPQDFDVRTATPKDYFSLFVTEEMLETITKNTNSYQQFVVDRKRIADPNYIDKLWTKNVDLPEMKAYLGLSIMMGLVQVPRFKCYWSTCTFLGNQGFKSTIPIRRYEKITEYLHVSDRKSEPPRTGRYYDRIHKVRWLLESLNSSFSKYYAPTRDQTIDEGKLLTADYGFNT